MVPLPPVSDETFTTSEPPLLMVSTGLLVADASTVITEPIMTRVQPSMSRSADSLIGKLSKR